MLASDATRGTVTSGSVDPRSPLQSAGHSRDGKIPFHHNDLSVLRKRHDAARSAWSAWARQEIPGYANAAIGCCRCQSRHEAIY
jgi:hypothetical protein